jgi:hypothetical protein
MNESLEKFERMTAGRETLNIWTKKSPDRGASQMLRVPLVTWSGDDWHH